MLPDHPPIPVLETLIVDDQFGREEVRINSPTHLCTPAFKYRVELGEVPPDKPVAPVGFPHLKCYVLEFGKSINEEVILEDQFERTDVTVRRASLLCDFAKKERPGQPLDRFHSLHQFRREPLQ